MKNYLMKSVLALSILFLTSFSFAQTKLIAHKRYGGNHSNFKASNWIKESNLGVAPTIMVKNARLDSVILINDKQAVMVTSEVCTEEDHGGRATGYSKVWKPGRDTVFNHVLFNGKNNEEEIRTVLGRQYNFRNEPTNVVLVGFKKDEEIIHKKVKEKDTTSLELNPDEQEAKKKKRRGGDHMLKWVMVSILSIFFRTQI